MIYRNEVSQPQRLTILFKVAESYFVFPSGVYRNQDRYALKEDECQVSASGKMGRISGQLFCVGVFDQVVALSCSSLSPQTASYLSNNSWLANQLV